MAMKQDIIIPMSDDMKDFNGLFEMGFDNRRNLQDLFRELKISEDMMEKEMIAEPDTFGCDCIFLENFITERMEEDFSLVARDFLIHEFKNIKDFGTVQYLSTDSNECWPEKLFQNFVLNLMMNALNAGSMYTKNLFLYLYKIYYKSEYKQLKRFSTLSAGELISISNSDKGMIPVNVARILTIARLSGIKISNHCKFLYLFLNNYQKEISEKGHDWTYSESVFETYRECIDEVPGLFASEDEMYELYEKYEKYTENFLRIEGVREDFVLLCDEDDDGIRRRMGRTLAILRKTYGKRDFRKEEVILYAIISQTISALISSCYVMESRLNEVFLGEEGTDFFDNFPPLFNAGDVPAAREGLPVESKKPDEAKKQKEAKDTDLPKSREEELITEIEELRRRIHQMEGEVKQLKKDNAGHRKVEEENKSLKEQMEAEHRELSALREHLYHLTEEDEEKAPISVEEMTDYLKPKRIIIIGGHSNWVSKIKQVFGDWTYINPAVSGTLDASVVEKADRVYFFTDIISHTTYFKYINVVRERGISFGYIHGVNIENNIRQIYREMQE